MVDAMLVFRCNNIQQKWRGAALLRTLSLSGLGAVATNLQGRERPKLPKLLHVLLSVANPALLYSTS